MGALCPELKFGALDAGALDPASSARLKLMMSTMLETSFLIFSGKTVGSCFPVILRLHRYMARANSGKCNWPERVVSANVLGM